MDFHSSPEATFEHAPVQKPREYYIGDFRAISLEEVPSIVKEKFEFLAHRFLLPDHQHPLNPQQVLVLEHEDGTKTYIAKVDKTYQKVDSSFTEKSLYSVDISQDGDFLGWGEVVWNVEEQKKKYFKNKPYLASDFTEDNFQKRGYGVRRLRFLNVLSRENYGFPLNSDSVMSEFEIKTWDKLVATGEARKYEESPGVERYVFVS